VRISVFFAAFGFPLRETKASKKAAFAQSRRDNQKAQRKTKPLSESGALAELRPQCFLIEKPAEYHTRPALNHSQ